MSLKWHVSTTPECMVKTILQLKVEFEEIKELKGSLSYQWRPMNARKSFKEKKTAPLRTFVKKARVEHKI